MHIALVALPWAERSRPCCSIPALAGYLRRAEPTWRIDSHYDYVLIAEKLGFRLYDEIAESCYVLGETLNIGLLYPDQRKTATEQFCELYTKKKARPHASADQRALGVESHAIAAALQAHFVEYDACLAQLADRLSRCDAVGLTTSFGQVFSNLALAKKLKAKNSDIKIILGGSSISSAVGPSLLEEYDFIDYIIQGEGEIPLLSLSRALALGAEHEIPAIRSVVTRGSSALHAASGAPLTEVDSMDSLPIPDLDEYGQIAERLGIEWQVPIEGSRGCWWDRAKKTGDPKQTCYFCNLNIQWNGYREKSIGRVVEELKLQSDRYNKTEFYFLDNIIRHKGMDELALRIRESGRDYRIFYEMRANVTPYQFLLLAEAGVQSVQIGIEALSTSLLKRFGKGTTAIKNLEAMRTISELGIVHFGNLILGFPGSTQEEADETLRVASEYAVAYEPLVHSQFSLSRDNTVYKLQDQFPISNVRNRDTYVRVLPEGVGQRLKLLELDFDQLPGAADWSRVARFIRHWYSHPRERVLFYRAAGDIIRIVDGRGLLANLFEGMDGDVPFLRSLPRGRIFDLRGKERELYLFCMSVRSLQEIEERLAANQEERHTIHRLLDLWDEARLIFREGPRVLSLAIAQTPEDGAARIRAQHRIDELCVAKQSRASKRLQLVG
jgi:ribosomal peptide maturation radical SAM protein 1